MNESTTDGMKQQKDFVVGKKGINHVIIEAILTILTLIFLALFIVFLCLYIHERNKDKSCKEIIQSESYKPSENQYIPIIEDMDNEGASEYRGKLDKPNSKYFKSIDIYNTKSSGSLIILEKFKTYQQTSSYSCGCASLIMAIYYLDGTIIGEQDCSNKAKSVPHNGTLPENLEKAINEYGYDYESKTKGFDKDEVPSYDPDKFSEYIKNSLKNNESIIILSNDWGGHYTVIIGYDDMGTEGIEDDVVIIADPFDTSDHMNDGYTIWSYERLYYQMEIEVFGIPGNNYDFIKVKRKSS
jgi:predicted double-glycine peptidase